ncbi:hypothetical protein PPTG_24517 [Phytophthora nicotianae INRA-310]|uniref:DUF7726 domain-containing protein n=1 Tax=Phytophthora nicotianae (strain INRA-310) TaxID=761204 RepID=W2PG94_PHYN3|nr:hypothetical protein PPTG_24517 [Phytophthora nicotianae INRA-310]ETM99029.1 hypothetical protein PPTG_24517 [Phytophthora nicotianae INRA-310]
MVIRQSTMDCDEMRKKINEFLGEKIITQTAFLKALGNVSANSLRSFISLKRHSNINRTDLRSRVSHTNSTQTISDQHAGTWRNTELDGSSPSVLTDTGDPKKRKATLSLRKDHYQVIQQV